MVRIEQTVSFVKKNGIDFERGNGFTECCNDRFNLEAVFKMMWIGRQAGRESIMKLDEILKALYPHTLVLVRSLDNCIWVGLKPAEEMLLSLDIFPTLEVSGVRARHNARHDDFVEIVIPMGV